MGWNLEAAGANVIVAGGETAALEAYFGTTVVVKGGNVVDLDVYDGATAEILAGTIGSPLKVHAGGTISLLGGTLGDQLFAEEGSSAHLFGTEFLVDGVDIRDMLEENVPFTLEDRDVTLSGLLADGSPFSFDIQDEAYFPFIHFHSDALLTLTLVLPGDFNSDGKVDEEDYSIWQGAYGATIASRFSGGDADGDHDVDGRDILIWQRQLGIDINSMRASQAVPEPPSLVILAWAVVAWGTWKTGRALPGG